MATVEQATAPADERPAEPSEPSEPTAPAVGAPVVRVRGLRRAFGDHEVLTGVDLEIAAGEIVALVGRSGSGKSTLLRVLAGLDTEATGEVEQPASVGIAFQDARLLPWKRVTANVVLGLREPDAAERARAVLDEVGLADHARAWPRTLSGGEAQRVSLARALVRNPQLLLLDEPFGALDALTRLSMHDLVLSLWRRHRPAVLLVTHDIDEAVTLADRVVVLHEGRFLEPVEVLLPRPRPRRDPEFGRLRAELLDLLGVDPETH